MNLVRINNRFFNMDLLVEANSSPVSAGAQRRVELHFAAPGGDRDNDAPHVAVLKGEEAGAMIAWLDDNAEEAVPAVKELKASNA